MIDQSIFAEFTGGDKEFELDLICTFIDESIEYSTLFTSNYAEGNLDELSKLAHKLKSSTDVFGLTNFRNMLFELEMGSKKGLNKEEITEQYSTVISTFDDVIKEMIELKKSYS